MNMTKNVLYPTLEAEIAKHGVSKKTVAKVLGVTPRAMSHKLKGITRFTLEEAIAIQELFPEASIQELFRRAEEPQDKTA